MQLPLSHLWFTNSRFESNRSLTRTALLFVIHHYAKFATFAVCFVIIPLPYALTEYSSLQSCCSFFFPHLSIHSLIFLMTTVRQTRSVNSSKAYSAHSSNLLASSSGHPSTMCASRFSNLTRVANF